MKFSRKIIAMRRPLEQPANLDDQVLKQLAPTGVLRAGINLSNFLLVSGRSERDDPVGVSPDMASAIASRCGLSVEFVCYESPGQLAAAAESDEWDIGNIGAEPQRAMTIAFTPAYCEIESTYLVPADSPISSIEAVDQPGVQIAYVTGTAYGLWLEANTKNASLVAAETIDASFDIFVKGKLDVLAGLRPRLSSDVQKLSGARILDGKFSSVQQAVGTPRKNQAAAQWLTAFVEEAKASGLVAELIAKHRVVGLSVADAAPVRKNA